MDYAFIKEVQTSPEVEKMLRSLRDVSNLHRENPIRQSILSDIALLWAAIADAIGPIHENSSELEMKLLTIARDGSDACLAASRAANPQALQRCTRYLRDFLETPIH